MSVTDTSMTVAHAATDHHRTATGHTIGEASAATGVSIETLRYYERAGLMPAITRDAGGRRTYSDDDLGWIRFVRRLRATGMPVTEIADYARMVREGDGTVESRRRLLETHRERVRAAIDELTVAAETLDRKIAHYEAAERGIDVGCSDDPIRIDRVTLGDADDR